LHPCAGSENGAARHTGLDPQMTEVFDHAIVIHDSTTVHNDTLTQPRLRTDNRSRHQHRAGADNSSRRKQCCGMDDGRKRQTSFPNALMQGSSHGVVSNGDNHFVDPPQELGQH